MKFGRYILFTGFLLIIFSFCFLNFFTENRKTSTLENRTLAQEPVKDPKLIWSGEYFKQFESYFSDQFVKRDKWIEYYTQLQMKVSPAYVNGYYVTKDNYILKQPVTSPQEKQLDHTAKQVNRFGDMLSKKNTDFYYVLYPSKINTLSKNLPSYLPKSNDESNKDYLFSLLNQDTYHVVDVEEDFHPEKEEGGMKSFYFKTDHHWNMKGAFTAYQSMIGIISKDHPEVTNDTDPSLYTPSCLKGYDFTGSWNKQLSMQVDVSGEKVCYQTPKNYSFADYKVFENGWEPKNQKSFSYFYARILQKDRKNLEYGDGYTWDIGEINILNPHSTNDLKVLILKDSYTNPITFHLAHHFKKTTVYDIRHNPTRTVYDYVNANDFDIVIAAYNDQNIYSSMMHGFDQIIKYKE